MDFNSLSEGAILAGTIALVVVVWAGVLHICLRDLDQFGKSFWRNDN